MREVEVHELNAAFVVHIVLVEDAVHFFRRQFGMRVVGNVLGSVAQLFAHLRGQHVTEVLLQNVANAALARLAVDTNDVGLVMAAHIGGVDRQVRRGPVLGVVLLAPLQALGDSVLMAAREGREHELASVGAARLNLHIGHALVQFDQFRHVGEVQLRINAMGEHVHGDGNQVGVARALAIAEQGALNAVGASQNAQLGFGNARAAVVVAVQRQLNGVAVLQVLAHVLDLLREYMRQAHFDRRGQVDDGLAIGGRLPYVQNGVAYLERVLGLGAGEAFGRVLEAVVVVAGFVGELLQQLSAGQSDFLDLLFVALEYLFALREARGVVYVNDDGSLAAFKGVERFLDNVLARLGEHLNGDVFGNHVVLDERAGQLKFGFAGSGEADLDFLESNLDEFLEVFQLLVEAHRNDECLVAVAKVNAHPLRGFLDVFLLRPVEARLGRHEISALILYMVGHSGHGRLPFCGWPHGGTFRLQTWNALAFIRSSAARGRKFRACERTPG